MFHKLIMRYQHHKSQFINQYHPCYQTLCLTTMFINLEVSVDFGREI